jgi:urocanate hydratase
MDDFLPDVVTDQTSAHDELQGYVPHGMPYEAALELRKSDPAQYIDMAYDSMAVHCRAMLDLLKKGAVVFDYGNNLRRQAMRARGDNAMDFPGFVPAYIRPLFCEGEGPFRWAAPPAIPADIDVIDEELLKLFPEKNPHGTLAGDGPKKVAHMGLPARICWLGYGEREKAGKLFNDLVASGR